MKLTKILLKLILLLLCACSYQSTSQNTTTQTKKMPSYANIKASDWQIRSKTQKLKGWDYVAEKLVAKKIDKKVIIDIFSSNDMPYWTPITFKTKPREPSSIYTKFNTNKNRENALSFYKENKKHFKAAEETFKVPAEYILAILQIETQCGQNTGNDSVFYWLARLISTGFPPNIEYNLENTEEKPTPSSKEFEERATWLEEEFTPHLIALIEMANKSGISPLDVKGSKGGALGYPQFLPGNIEKYGIDGDKSGSINLFTAADAIHSVANFLNKHGWKSHSTKNDKTNTILEYNRSSAYASTVMEMAESLKNNL